MICFEGKIGRSSNNILIDIEVIFYKVFFYESFNIGKAWTVEMEFE